MLVITHSPQSHRSLLRILSDQGFQIALANDGVAGYHRAQLHEPKVILMDSKIARIESAALIHMLRGLRATASIPILVLTHKHSHDECVLMLKAGAVDYIGMPYAADEVIERMNVHLRLSGAGAPSAGKADAVDGAMAGSKLKEEARMLIHAIQEVIETSISSPPSQAELCNMFNVSRRKLSEVFGSGFGMSVSEYIRRKRMLRAEHLLKVTTLKLEVIADELGFSSSANFSTAFKAHSGLSPRGFRNKFQRSNSAQEY